MIHLGDPELAFVRDVTRSPWFLQPTGRRRACSGLRGAGGYTHRVAISNHRLRSLENGRVSFEWKDYADRSRTKTMTLEATEFIRRFLLHILPSGLVRIRQFGFLANRIRQHKLEHCRTLLALCQPCTLIRSDIGADVRRPDAKACPICKQGRLIVIELVAAEPIPFLNTS